MKLDEALWRAFDGSVRARPLSKHLGNQHDQKTHGRRKAGPRVVLGKDAFEEAQAAHEELRKYNKAGVYQGGLKDNIARTIGETLVEEFDDNDLMETMRLLGVSGQRRIRQYDLALGTLQVNDDAFEQFLRGLDRDVGVGKVMEELAREYFGSDIDLVMLRDALETDSVDPEARDYLRFRFQERATNELVRMAKGEDSTRMLTSASVMSGVMFGLRRTEAGKLELATVSSTSDPSYVSGSRSTAVENMMGLGVIDIGLSDGYAVADGLVAAWASSSASPSSQLLQDQVSQMFGLADARLETSPSTDRRRSNILDSTYYNSRTKPVIRRVAELMYENTQTLLAETPGDSITLYRGLTSNELWARAFEVAGSGSSATLNVEQLPLSSWSASVSTSKEFADRGPDVGSLVMGTTVPKSRIFSMPFTGLGCYDEAEFVVLGSESDPVVVFVDPQRLREAEALDIVVESFIDSATTLSEATIKKGAEGNINIDADIRNADWVKQTFDFPEVTTAKKYREKFGLEDDEALDEHIKEWKGTPYWDGIPSKIKTGLLKARLSKHLGTQHDQKTHGRRKNGLAPQAEYETGIGTVKDDMPTPSKVEERRYTNEEALVVAKEIFELSIELSDGRTIDSVVSWANGGLIGDISVQGRLYIKENGEWQHAGVFSRQLYAKDGTAYNSFFNIVTSLQGQGIGTTILRHWEDQYYQAGFSKMNLAAVSNDQSNGAYTWLKYGYTPDEPESLLSEYVTDLMDRFDEGTPPDVVVQSLAPVLDMVGADDPNGFYDRIQSREDSRDIVDDLESAIFRSSKAIDPLELVSSSDDFVNFLKEEASWDGSKETSPLFSDQYAKSAEASKSARDVINRWMVEDPAGLENDDPKFWQEIRDAYGKVSKHLAGGPYDHDQQTHGRGASGGASRVRAIADEFKGQVSHCQTASGSERQCISAEHQFRTWLSENHPEVAYRSYYVRGAKPEAVAPERLLPLSGGFETEPEWILRDQNHNIPAIGVPDENGKLQWFTVDWTYRQFQPDSEWPLIEEGAIATERWDETTVFNERGPLKT